MQVGELVPLAMQLRLLDGLTGLLVLEDQLRERVDAAASERDARVARLLPNQTRVSGG